MRESSGIERRQGAHHEAQKSSTSTWPANSDGLVFSFCTPNSSSFRSVTSGNGSPGSVGRILFAYLALDTPAPTSANTKVTPNAPRPIVRNFVDPADDAGSDDDEAAGPATTSPLGTCACARNQGI